MASRFQYGSAASGTETVPAACVAVLVTCHATSAGTLVITPNGGSAGASIPIPAGAAFTFPLDEDEQELGAGSTFVFTGTDSYFVQYRKVGG